ncbi:MAG: redoxin domain-containing protein [Acidobacteria bacterium]|nr:MAG: redoxin domain-containing protein [Acidobacteriota bacterium]
MQRWESFQSDFEALALGGRMVAISADTVTEAAKMRSKHELKLTLLSDESLEVTRLYNLAYKTYTPVRGPKRHLAIPTTFLIGGDGLVKWIDQAKDHRVRSDEDVVLAAVREALSADS